MNTGNHIAGISLDNWSNYLKWHLKQTHSSGSVVVEPKCIIDALNNDPNRQHDDGPERIRIDDVTLDADEAINEIKTFTATIRSFTAYIEKNNWLKSDLDRVSRKLAMLNDLYYYIHSICRKGGFATAMEHAVSGQHIGLNGQHHMLVLNTFLPLYEQCQTFQAYLVNYILSEHFARLSPALETLRMVLKRINSILRTIDGFDLRGSAVLWKCVVKLAKDHSTVLLQATKADAFEPLLTRIHEQILTLTKRLNEFATESISDSAEREKNMKLAIFYAKIMLRLYTVFGVKTVYNLFTPFVKCLVELKSQLQQVHTNEVQMQDLLALFEQAFHVIYGHGLLQHASNYSGCCVEIYLELYMIILAKLMTETDEDVVQIYAQSAFFASYIGHALQHLCLEFPSMPQNTDHFRLAVVRIASLTILTAQRFPHLVKLIDDALLQALQNHDYYTGLLVYDVWQLRCDLMSPSQRLRYALNVWSHAIGGDNAVLCFRTSSVFGRALLCSFYDALSLDLQNEFVDKTNDCVVGMVLGVDRIADAARRQKMTQRLINVLTTRPASTMRLHDRRKQYYCIEQAMNALRDVSDPKAIALLDIKCDQLHVEFPSVFATELRYVLCNTSALRQGHVERLLESLATYLTHRVAGTVPKNCLIRLQAIDLLMHVCVMDLTSRSKCIRDAAILIAKMLTADDIVVQMYCLRRFTEIIGSQMRNESIISQTLQSDMRLKLDVERTLHKDPLPALLPQCLDSDRRPWSNIKAEHICGFFGSAFQSAAAISEAVASLRANIRSIERYIRADGIISAEHTKELNCAREEFERAFGSCVKNP